MKRIFATGWAAALLVGIGLGMSTGVAGANTLGPYNWCPGMQKSAFMPHDGVPGPASPGPSAQWDWNVCHTFWVTSYGNGNVPGTQDIWDGADPPPPPGPPPPGVINADNCLQILGPVICPHPYG